MQWIRPYIVKITNELFSEKCIKMQAIDSINQKQLLDLSSPGNVYLNVTKNILVLIFLYSFIFYLTHV